jgi:hypothetical protein
MQTVNLSIGKVEIIDQLTWGMQEKLREVIFSNAKINAKQSELADPNYVVDLKETYKGKYIALALCVKKITLTDGTEVNYTQDWMDNLSIDDGDTLMKAVDEMITPKTKKK